MRVYIPLQKKNKKRKENDTEKIVERLVKLLTKSNGKIYYQ